METVTSWLIVGLACTLSFAAGCAMDAAVNRLVKNIERQTMAHMSGTIETQQETIAIMEKTGKIQDQTIDLLQKRLGEK